MGIIEVKLEYEKILLKFTFLWLAARKNDKKIDVIVEIILYNPTYFYEIWGFHILHKKVIIEMELCRNIFITSLSAAV